MELLDHDAQGHKQENSDLSTIRFLSERREIRIKPKISYMQELLSLSDVTVAMDQRIMHDTTCILPKALPLQRRARARQPEAVRPSL